MTVAHNDNSKPPFSHCRPATADHNAIYGPYEGLTQGHHAPANHHFPTADHCHLYRMTVAHNDNSKPPFSHCRPATADHNAIYGPYEGLTQGHHAPANHHFPTADHCHLYRMTVAHNDTSKPPISDCQPATVDYNVIYGPYEGLTQGH